MVTVPNDLKEIIYNENVKKNIRIVFPNEEHDDICNDAIIAESMELKENLCTEKQLKFGSCEASQLKFTTYDLTDIAGCKIEVYLEVFVAQTCQDAIYKEDLEHFVYPLQLGVYYVNKCEISVDDKTNKVTCYDRMRYIRMSNVASWYNALTFPISMRAFRTSFSQRVGVEQSIVALINDDMPIYRTIYDDNISGLEVLTAICEANGVMAHIGRYGQLSYIHLDPAEGSLYPSEYLFPDTTLFPGGSEATYESTLVESMKHEDYQVAGATGVQIIAEDGDVGAFYGTNANIYIVQGNFLLFGKEEEELEGIAENILSNIKNAKYIPFDADVKGNPIVEVGDFLTVSDNYSIVLERTLKGIQSLTDNLASSGLEKFEVDTNTPESQRQIIEQKTHILQNDLNGFHSEFNTYKQTIQGQFNNTYSYIDQTAEQIEAKVAAGSVIWNEEDYEIKYYGFGEPPKSYTVQPSVGQLYLDQGTGIVWEIKTVTKSGDVYAVIWQQKAQLEKTISEYYTLIDQNAKAISAEVTARQTAITNEANARTTATTELSNRITATADSLAIDISEVDSKITTEELARQEAVSSLNSKINVNTQSISSEVSARTTQYNTINGKVDANTTAISEQSARITQTNNSITAEVKARTEQYNTIDGKVDESTKEISELSSSLTQTASSLASEITARKSADSELSSSLTQTASSLASEITARQSADDNLSSSITQTAEGIRSQVSQNQKIWNTGGMDIKYLYPTNPPSETTSMEYSANELWLNTSNGNLYRYIGSTSTTPGEYTHQWRHILTLDLMYKDSSSAFEQTAEEISAKVESYGGSQSSFSWSLDANGFYLWSNGTQVAKFDKNSAVFRGMIQAGSGYIGSDTQGFTLDSNGTLTSRETVTFKLPSIYGDYTEPKIKITAESIELLGINSNGKCAYTYIGSGCIYTCVPDHTHTPTENAPWGYVGQNEMILKDGNLYIPNRTTKNGEVGNIFVQNNAVVKSGKLTTQQYRKGMYADAFTVKDTNGNSHTLRIHNGVIMSGTATYDDPFYNGETFPT